MANYEEPEDGMEESYLEWCSTRPENVRKVAERFRPWKLYRNGPSGHRCILLAFGEGDNDTVTVRVLIPACFNLLMFEREVFGINPDDLVECDLPATDEITGALMTPEDVDANMPALRAIVQAARVRDN